jgi:glycosyltransferase involved in cell wall biosynthesis
MMRRSSVFHGRVGIVQRVLPVYRVPLFEQLAGRCPDGLSIAAGRARAAESLEEAEVVSGARLHRLHNRHWGRGVTYLCWQTGVIGWLNAWNPDALVVEANPRCVSTPMAVWWMRRRGRQILGWGLGTRPITSGFYRLRGVLRPWFLAMFDGLIAYGSRAADEYAAAGVSRERIYVAHNAVRSRGRQSTRRGTRSGSRRHVLFVGRLTRGKRVDLLLRACAALPEHLQPALTVVGDGEARREAEALARAVYPTTKFAGSRRGSDLEEYWRQADVFALPGQGGLAIQEAMAHGLPVIVGEADGTHIDLVRPANGWIVPRRDLGALTTVLAEALSDTDRLDRMGRESLRIVEEEINLETMAQSMVEALSTVTEQGSRKGRAAAELK